MSQLDQHLTTEQLSTLLDSTDFSSTEVIESDQDNLADLQLHLSGCELCQQELAELRQTVALLRALPQPKLPRSFALPAGIQQSPAHTASVTPSSKRPTTIPGKQRRTKRTTTLRIIMQTVSGLAAVVGILFVLSSLFNVIPFLSSSNNGGNGITGPYRSSGIDRNGSLVTPDTADTNASDERQNNAQRGDAKQQTQPSTTSAATVSPQPTQSAKGVSSTQPDYQSIAQPSNTLQDIPLFILSAQGRMGTGILLFLLGACGFSYFKQHTKVPAGP